MKITALQLSQAGFDNDTIKSYVDTQVPLLEKAGFNKKEIYNSYGITPLNSKSLLDTDMQDDTTAITNNELPLGKKTSLMKRSDEETQNTVKNNLTSDGKYNIKNTTFDLLKEQDQASILNKIDEAYKLFKDDGEGRIGFFNDWMETYYPNVAYEKEKFSNNEDLTLAESALNDEQVKLLENAQAKDIIGGNQGFNINNGENYVYDPDFRKAEKESEVIKVLHTPFSTGKETKAILEYTKNHYKFNDMQIMYINEFLSFVSGVSSGNKNIYNSDGTKGGIFQFSKKQLISSLNNLVNLNSRNNKNYKVPDWVSQAYFHQDPTRLLPDEQKAIALANFLEIPKSEKYNRDNSDELIKAIANGDVEAMKKLYLEYHHADYVENIDDTGEGDPYYTLRPNAMLKERTDQYFSKWGTAKYDYETAQIAYWGSDSVVTKAIEKLPFGVGEKFLNAFGGKGYYSAFTNGYETSASGLLDRYYQIFIDDPNADPKEAIQKLFMHQEQRFDKEIIQSVGTLVGDLPFMITGCFAAGGAALAGTLGAATPALPVICGAGGFALPEVIRSSYMRAIEDNFVGSFPEFLSHYMDKKTAIVAGKSAIIGGATFGAGAKVKALTGSTTARLATEVGVMTTLGAAMEGHVPTLRDFAHATVLVFGIHGSFQGMKTLKNIYTKYAVHPRDVIKQIENNPIAMIELKSGKIPSMYKEGSKTVIKEIEKQSNIKLLPPPKFKNNETVNISVSGTEKGRVVGKEVIGQETIIKVEKPNGAVVPVLESQVRKAPTKPIEIKIEGDKININIAKDNSFIERQSNGEFSSDIIELIKNKDGIYTTKEFKTNPEIVVKQTGSSNKIETLDGKTIANETITIQSKFYPKLVKEFKNNKTLKTQYKSAKDLINKERNGISSILKKVETLFALKGNVENIILRVGDNNVSIPRSAYESLIKFEEKGKIKTAEIMGSDANQPIIFLHPETGKIIATIKPKKINGEMDAQASNYFDNFKEKDGVFYDRVNSSRDGDNWGIPRDIFTEKKELPADYGSNAAQWKGLFNSAKGLDMIDLVELYKVFVKKSPELKNLPEGLNGYFQFKGKKSPRIVINEALQKNPEQFLMTFAHELGHLIDYLPNATLSRGNILGSIAALKGYMNKWIDGKNQGMKPFSPKEIEAMKKAAIKEAKSKEKETNAEILQLEITPDTILKIFNDASAREKINPDFYNAFVKLPAEVKKLVVKDAMKGLMSQHMKAIADKINGKPTDSRLTNEAYKIFKKKFEQQIKERNLVNKELITNELKSLSAKWKPFDRAAKKSYTEYRDGPRELMADFMMAFMIKPQWVKNNAPRTWEMWMHYMDARPEVKASWERIQLEMKSGPDARLGDVIVKIGDMYRKTNEEIFALQQKEYKPQLYDKLSAEVIDRHAWLYRRWKGTGRTRWHSETAKDLNYAIEFDRYKHAKLKRYTDDIVRKVVKPAENLGYDQIDLSTMLLLRNLAESSQRKGLVNSLGIMKVDSKLSNVLGGRTAKEAYDYYVKLHPQLLELTNEFYKIRKEMVIPELKNSGMYDAKLIEKLENNKEYITFNVKKYLLQRIEKYGENASATPLLKGSKGTFEDIQAVFNATMEKDMLLITEARRHKAMSLTVDFLLENKSRLETFGKRETKDRVIYKPKFIGEGKLERPAKGFERFSFMKDGKMQHWHVNEFVAKGFRHDPLNMLFLQKMFTGTGDIFRKVFTEYNPAFWPVNLTKDLNRSVKLLPNARYIDIAGKGKSSLLKYYWKAIKPAYKSIFGDGTKLTRWMEEEGFLISMNEGYRGQAGSKALLKGLDADTYAIEKLLGDMQKKKGFDKFYNDTFGLLFNRFSGFARMFERVPKIGGVMFLKDQIKNKQLTMSNKEMMIKVQGEVGSPNFLRQGLSNAVTNNLWLYSNATKEGTRGDYTRFREDPASVGMKFIAYNASQMLFQKAIKYGLFGAGLAMAYKYGISEWDQDNYINIVLGETPDGRIVYLRIPQDDSSRLINGMLSKGIDGIIDEQKSGLETVSDIISYMSSSGTPALNPIINLFGDLVTVMEGNTPFDEFRNTPAIDRKIDQADDARRNVELLKWFMNTYTGQGIYKFKANSYDEVSTELENILEMPLVGTVLGRFIKVGEHPAVKYINEAEGGVQDYKKQEAQIDLDYRDGIVNLLRGNDLSENQINALKLKAENIRSSNLLIEQLGRLAGSTPLLDEFINEDDPELLGRKLMILIEFIEKTDNEYPINFIKKEKSDKIEE